VGELPSGTVTFLFTDLESSTRLWEEHPEAMKAALARHDEILRDAIESHGGHVVKTTGDGVHGAFATADDAVAAAVDGQPPSRGDRPVRCASAWVCTPVRRSNARATTTAPR
jgi:class 3 adenylate cyclase